MTLAAVLVLTSGAGKVAALIGGTSPTLGLSESWRFAPVIIGGALAAIERILASLAGGRSLSATLAVIVGSGSKAAGAERLPRAMIDGYLGAVPQGQPTLRAALAKRPKVLATVGHLLDPFAER